LSFVLVLGVLAGCRGEGDQTAANGNQGGSSSGQTKQGGVLKVAIGSDPQTLDWMATSDTLAKMIGMNIFEPLFGYNQDFEVKPMLAESYDVSSDGKTYTIKLRKGVHFHNGSTMKAEDVVASLKRWGRPAISGIGAETFEHVKDVKAVDDETVRIDLKDEYKLLIENMAALKNAMVVLPADIANAAGDDKLTDDQLIGTGPYQLKELKSGQEVTLQRFKDYTPRDQDNGGTLAGIKTPHLDEIQFQVVKDPQVRVDGMVTGKYDYAEKVPFDLYKTIQSHHDLQPITFMDGYLTLMLNQSRPPFDNVKVRKAVNAALDKKSIGQAVYGNPKFYELNGALFSKDQKSLYVEKGTEGYQAYDPKKAKQLLKEAGYEGESIDLAAAPSKDDHYKMAQIAAQQLRKVGFNVRVKSQEWATLLNTQEDKKGWKMMAMGWSPRFSPTELTMLTPDSFESGWYQGKRWESLLDQWGATTDADQQKKILGEMNQLVYDEMPFIKILDRTQLDAISTRVKGFQAWGGGQKFWNVSLSPGKE
jgi:peptide/nickel transport system substrate-binding protein